MCGIAGIRTLSRDVMGAAPLAQMQDAIRHRGPDDEGRVLLEEAGVGLLHSRLAIIDLSPLGHQPMWDDEHEVCIVFNGEIYNFEKVRARLERLGERFRSRSDTEVLVKGYRRWGVEVLDHLAGIFALAIWDARDRTLFLARDRLGKKPLYYHHDPTTRTLVFGSEIKALLACPWVERVVDPLSVHSYLALGFVPAPRTMFRNIHKLPAAHWLRFDGERIHTQRFWDVGPLASVRGSPRELRAHVRELLEHAVDRRLVSDVPVGAYLSGGIDSTIVVALMSARARTPVRTFSSAFEVGPRSFKYNADADGADKTAALLGTDHTRLTIPLERETLDTTLRAVVRHMDEPHAHPTLITNYLLAREVKKRGVTVVLTGDGGDEVFGGYERYMRDRFVDVAAKVPAPLRRVMAAAPLPARAAAIRKALDKAELPSGSAERGLSWWEQTPPERRRAWLDPTLGAYEGAPLAAYEAVAARADGGTGQDVLCYLDTQLWLADDSNMRTDKMNMAHAVEARAPFQDHDLVEYALAIPFGQRAGWREGKQLLKRTFADVLPDHVVRREKTGWWSPLYYWLRDAQWDTVTEAVHALPKTGLFRPEVKELVAHNPPREALRTWSVFTFALWHDEFIAPLGLSR